jgi:hypothetical protein
MSTRAHDETDPPTGADDAHRLGDRPMRVAFLEHGDRIGAIERTVLEGQCLGIALGESDQLPEPLRLGQLSGFAQQKWVHIGRGDGIGIAEPPRQQANQRTGAAADFEDRLAAPRPDLVDQGSEHRLIGRHPGAVLERSNTPQMGATEGHDREVSG